MNRLEDSPVRTSTDVAPHPVIQYIGHSCFLIVAPDGTRIITDPYSFAAAYLPFPADVEANLITVSHGLDDFFHLRALRGCPTIISEAIADRIGLVEVTSYDSLRGGQNGIYRGINKIFVFKIGSTKIVHLGELGKIERPEVYEAIKDADVMLVPAGQVGAMSFDQLNELVAQTKARTVIPSYFGISDTEQWPSLRMVEEYIEALPPGTVVVKADELVVMPNMPKQVIILTLRAFETTWRNLSVTETYLDLTQNSITVQAVLCNKKTHHWVMPSGDKDTLYQALWAGSLRSEVDAWIDLWKHRPISSCNEN
jgi:L-ascorbate metabolism protein UlaG (beta-lactamase superfamily)